MKLRVLIVDDEAATAKGHAALLKLIKAEDLRRHGITEIETRLAFSYRGAIAALEEAAAQGALFDAAAVDLQLPEHDGGRENLDYFGFGILEAGISGATVREAIVVTGYGAMDDNVARSFRGGAFDFLSKQSNPDELVRRVLSAWDRSLEKRCESTFQERLKTLACRAESGLSYRLGIVFFECVREVQRELENLTREVSERQGLSVERDAGDPLFVSLAKTKDATLRSVAKWEKQIEPWNGQTESAVVRQVADIFEEVHSSLAPCLIVKHAKIEATLPSQAAILSFGTEVHVVLKEMLLGALLNLATATIDHEHRLGISVDLQNREGLVTLALEDECAAIPPAVAQRINQGLSVAGVERFTREWGLSVVQQVAWRSGGRIEVCRRENGGNLILFHIPAAHEAHPGS